MWCLTAVKKKGVDDEHHANRKLARGAICHGLAVSLANRQQSNTDPPFSDGHSGTAD